MEFNWFDDDTDEDRKIDIFDTDHNGNEVKDDRTIR